MHLGSQYGATHGQLWVDLQGGSGSRLLIFPEFTGTRRSEAGKLGLARWVGGGGSSLQGCPGPAAPVNKVRTSPELLAHLGSHRAPTWAAEEGSRSELRK